MMTIPTACELTLNVDQRSEYVTYRILSGCILYIIIAYIMNYPI